MKFRAIQTILIFLSAIFVVAVHQDDYCKVLNDQVTKFFRKENLPPGSTLLPSKGLSTSKFTSVMISWASFAPQQIVTEFNCLQKDDDKKKTRIKFVNYQAGSIYTYYDIVWDSSMTTGGKIDSKISAKFILTVDENNKTTFDATFRFRPRCKDLDSCCNRKSSPLDICYSRNCRSNELELLNQAFLEEGRAIIHEGLKNKFVNPVSTLATTSAKRKKFKK
jgi:hypothetical protein